MWIQENYFKALNPKNLLLWIIFNSNFSNILINGFFLKTFPNFSFLSYLSLFLRTFVLGVCPKYFSDLYRNYSFIFLRVIDSVNSKSYPNFLHFFFTWNFSVFLTYDFGGVIQWQRLSLFLFICYCLWKFLILITSGPNI